RELELALLKEKLKGKFFHEDTHAQMEGLLFDVEVRVDVDQFYGIEIDEFATQIAQVALWLIDHQMNMKISNTFGLYFKRLPLKKQPNIVLGNALHLDWEKVVSKNELSYILGNPPFVGSRMMNINQKSDIKNVAAEIKSKGILDFVCGWFIKAADYIRFTNIKTSFVSTNSIVQGEQAITLWKYLIYNKNMVINFAHQTFQWNNEAKGKAKVYCVIIGFSNQKKLEKILFSYPDIKGKPTSKVVKNINHYLLNAPTIFIEKRTHPISRVPSMIYGSMPRDGGNFLFTEEERDNFVMKEPLSQKYFRPWIGSQELVRGFRRYCLYLANCSPSELRRMPYVLEQVQKVKEMRLNSKAASTTKWADFPTRLVQDQVCDSDILIYSRGKPEHYTIIRIGYFGIETIASYQTFRVINADKYLFVILNSAMHMAWTKTVCGRLQSRYRYSNTLVYNNFIFPEPTDKHRRDIEKAARSILKIRENYPNSTMADLYDPLVTPPDLLKAHNELDRAVDKAYGKTFKSDDDRVSFLFEAYQNKMKEEIK